MRTLRDLGLWWKSNFPLRVAETERVVKLIFVANLAGRDEADDRMIPHAHISISFVFGGPLVWDGHHLA